MDGVILEQSEILVLMDSVRADAIVGFDNSLLLPSDKEIHRSLVKKGIEQLKQRGWLELQNDTHVLNGDLGVMAGVVAHPELVVITVKDTPGLGQQGFWHYIANRLAVEFTMPEVNQFRMAALSNLETVLRRVQYLLSVQNGRFSPPINFTIPQQLFFDVKNLIEEGSRQKALDALKSEKVELVIANNLLDVMENPQLSATVALLRCQESEVVDARNIALLKGSQTDWLIKQTVAGEPIFEIQSITADSFFKILVDQLVELAQPIV